MSVDPATYPRLAAYLDALQNGIDGYPKCQLASHLPRLQQRRYAELWREPGLPEPLQRALNLPMADHAWVPATVAVCQAMIVCDRRLSEDAYLQRARSAALEHLKSPLNRAVTRLLSPTLLLLGASTRWEKFARGTALTRVDSGKNHHTLRLGFPPYLFHPLNLRFLGTIFPALLEAAGAHQVSLDVQVPSPSEALFVLHWEA